MPAPTLHWFHLARGGRHLGALDRALASRPACRPARKQEFEKRKCVGLQVASGELWAATRSPVAPVAGELLAPSSKLQTGHSATPKTVLGEWK